MIKLLLKLYILNCFFILIFCKINYQEIFIEFTNKYNKIYNNQEFLIRFEIFKKNLDYIEKWNSKGSETVLGLNYLADLSNDEYQSIYLGHPIDTSKIIKNSHYNDHYSNNNNNNNKIKESIDWRLEFAVTRVKDQKTTCSAGYAFSVIGAIESLNYIKNDRLDVLSEQNLIDCDQGCKGTNLPSISYDYIIRQKGIDSEFSYPYEGMVIEPYEGRGRCRYNSFYSSASITSYVEIDSDNEYELINAISRSPISIMIDASKLSFQLYSSGIYIDDSCSNTIVNHGMLVVGYTKDYYIIKNSFSNIWGIKGYIHFEKNTNMCGINSLASYPVM